MAPICFHVLWPFIGRRMKMPNCIFILNDCDVLPCRLFQFGFGRVTELDWCQWCFWTSDFWVRAHPAAFDTDAFTSTMKPLDPSSFDSVLATQRPAQRCLLVLVLVLQLWPTTNDRSRSTRRVSVYETGSLFEPLFGSDVVQNVIWFVVRNRCRLCLRW